MPISRALAGSGARVSSPAAKDFGPIRDAYAFFEDHSTEAAEDVRVYAPHVHALAWTNRSIRMLDFGCGDGKFSVQFHAAARFPAHRLWLSLVEPDDVYRRQAVERLQPLTAYPVPAWPELPSNLEARFDLVLANHVLYYVPNLEDTIVAITRALAPSGLFLAAVAGQRNTLIHFCNHCFGLIGKSVPYHTAEDVEAALTRRRLSYSKEDVNYELVFPDSVANRLTIVRFLMGNYFRQVPRQAMLDLFKPYAADGKIIMQVTHQHFVMTMNENPRPTTS